MIIKYYTEGWNYIDKVEWAKSNKVKKDTFFKNLEKIKSGHKPSALMNDPKSTFGENNGAEYMAYKILSEKYFDTNGIEDRVVGKFFEPNDSKNEFTIIVFKRDNKYKVAMSERNTWYLLNDFGQTIEKIK